MLRCLEMSQNLLCVFYNVLSRLSCSCCCELFPIILVLFLLVVDCLDLVQDVFFGCFLSFNRRLVF